MKNCWQLTQILIENHLIFVVFKSAVFGFFLAVRKKVFILFCEFGNDISGNSAKYSNYKKMYL